MKIKQDFEGRTLVTLPHPNPVGFNTTLLFRRIKGAEPVWQEQIHTGESHNVFGTQAAKLEAQYQALVVLPVAPVPTRVPLFANPQAEAAFCAWRAEHSDCLRIVWGHPDTTPNVADSFDAFCLRRYTGRTDFVLTKNFN